MSADIFLSPSRLFTTVLLALWLSLASSPVGGQKSPCSNPESKECAEWKRHQQQMSEVVAKPTPAVQQVAQPPTTDPTQVQQQAQIGAAARRQAEREAAARRQAEIAAEKQRQAEIAERERQAEIDAETKRQAEVAERERQAETDAETKRQAETAERERQAKIDAETKRQAEVAERERQAEINAERIPIIAATSFALLAIAAGGWWTQLRPWPQWPPKIGVTVKVKPAAPPEFHCKTPAEHQVRVYVRIEPGEATIDRQPPIVGTEVRDV